MTTTLRRAAGLLLVGLLAVVLAGCGGFSSAPASAPTTKLRTYVALGDGFTAAPYAGRTTADDGCLRSARNYPALAAEQLGIQQVRDVSCTHAGTDALTGTFAPARSDRTQDPQLDAVDRNTDLVSIGAGIEDHGLLQEMFHVCLARPCAVGTFFYTQVLGDVTKAADAVTAAIRSVQDKAPDATIVVVGYPRLTPPPTQRCRAFPPQPSPGNQDIVNYVLGDLDSHLQSAARETGSAYVDVAALSEGHELCSSDPWVHGMTDEPGKAVGYHPLEAEQEAVATELVRQVRES